MPGLCLAIDTAGETCAAALFDGAAGKCVAVVSARPGRGHAELLMGQIEAVLKEAAVTYAYIGRIAVSVGPGSFTGIRVGVAAARGLALALGIPAVGVSVFEALAFPLLGQASPVLVVQDAKRGEVYAALFAANGQPLAAPCALMPDFLAGFCAPVAEGPLLVTGTGGEIAAAALPGRVLVSSSPDGLVDPAALARIALGREAGEPVRPLYLRGADAKPQQRPMLLRAAIPSPGDIPAQ